MESKHPTQAKIASSEMTQSVPKQWSCIINKTKKSQVEEVLNKSDSNQAVLGKYSSITQYLCYVIHLKYNAVVVLNLELETPSHAK